MKALRKVIRRAAKRLADYRYHRRCGHSIRQAWRLADKTL